MAVSKKTKTQLLDELYENPMPLTGDVKINIDILEQLWDYRFVLYKLANYSAESFKGNCEPEYYYRFVRFERRGSSSCSKVTVSNETAEEIIKRLGLVFQPQGLNPKNGGSYRQEGFSEFDLMRERKTESV